MNPSAPTTELACFPYGTGSQHEGVCLLLHLGNYRILLDCGLSTLDAIAPELADIDLVWCSHAHPDHARGLRQLHALHPDLPVIASQVTQQLLPLNWPAQAGTLTWITPLPWRVSIPLLPGLAAILIPAGHLPGAAILQLNYIPPLPSASGHTSYTVIYTGDMALSGMRCVEGLPLDELRKLRPDVLILEGSYGTARFPRRRQLENQLIERIVQALESDQSVLLPLPPIGMGPEMLILLRSHHRLTGQAIEIWVDTEIARSCDAYLELLPEFPRNIQNFARYQPLFWDDRIGPWVKRLPSTSDWQRSDTDPPCLLLISNECQWWHYQAALPDSALVLLLTKPGALSKGSKVNPVPAIPESLTLPWEPVFLSEHCDVSGTLQVIHSLRPQHIVLIHGSPSFLADLSSLDELSNRYQIHTPQVGHWVELPFGDQFHQPAPPENRYEGELTTSSSGIHLTLPAEIMLDPRWLSLADTGLLDIRWQGNSLVLSGITAQELAQRSRDWPSDWQNPTFEIGPTCATCRYFHGLHCRNLDSALAGLKVDREGYCPMYETR